MTDQKKDCFAKMQTADCLDHVTWWTALVDIASTLPDELALSDAPIHLVCNQRISVCDCAKRAIDLAQQEDPNLALSYRQKAQKYISGYDRRVLAQAQVNFNIKLRAYLLPMLAQVGLCLWFLLLYVFLAPTAHSLLVISILAGVLSFIVFLRLMGAYVTKARIKYKTYREDKDRRTRATAF